jgi:hypothetical protein
MNRFMLVALATSAVLASAQAATYSYAIADQTVTTTASGGTINTTGATGDVRAFYVTGTWNQIAGNPFSNEFRAQLPGVTNLGGGSLDRTMGGAGNNLTHNFVGPDTSTWNQNTTNPTLRGALTHLANGALTMGGNVNYALRQTFGGSSATMAGARFHFLTDIIAPQGVVINGSSPVMTGRPNSLTTTTSGSFRFNSFSFTAQATGIHHIGLYTGGVDGYLLAYNGAFSPTSTLTNLVGVDDVGDLGDSNSSGMFLTLTAGQSMTFVATTFTAGASMGNGLLTVAGPQAVPEPFSMVAMGAGLLALARRRRNAK